MRRAVVAYLVAYPWLGSHNTLRLFGDENEGNHVVGHLVTVVDKAFRS